MFSAILSILSANFLYFILHINNTSSFPKPLNSKDEANALERLKNGDKDARALLIERNLRLVSHIVKKYYLSENIPIPIMINDLEENSQMEDWLNTIDKLQLLLSDSKDSHYFIRGKLTDNKSVR